MHSRLKDLARTATCWQESDPAPDSTVDRFVRSGAFLVLFVGVFGMAWGIW